MLRMRCHTATAVIGYYRLTPCLRMAFAQQGSCTKVRFKKYIRHKCTAQQACWEQNHFENDWQDEHTNTAQETKRLLFDTRGPRANATTNAIPTPPQTRLMAVPDQVRFHPGGQFCFEIWARFLAQNCGQIWPQLRRNALCVPSKLGPDLVAQSVPNCGPQLSG